MAFSARVVYADAVNYCNSAGYGAVPQWASSHDYKAGDVVRPTTSTLNNERCFVALSDATSGAAEPVWAFTRGAKTTGSPAWMECTGGAAVNGDLVNTPTWTFVVGYLTGRKVAIGQIIKYVDTHTGDTSYQICSTAGVAGVAEPAFSKTGGAVTVDGTVVWTSLGLASKMIKGGAPHARITNAGVEHWFYGGGTIFVGDTHAEMQTGGTEMYFRTAYESTDPLLMSMMLCHDHAGNYPPTETDLRFEATVATDYRFNWYSGGSFYVYGITFKSKSYITLRPLGSVDTFFAADVNRQNWVMFDRCSFWLDSDLLVFGESYVFGVRVNAVIIFNNTTLRLGNTSSYISPLITNFTWRNTKPLLAPGSAVPRLLFSTYGLGGNLYDIVLESCDLSQMNTKVFFSEFWQLFGMVLKDCKLQQRTTFDMVPEDTGMQVQLARCDIGTATYRADRFVYEGLDTTEVLITRVGGAVDLAEQAQARRLTTTPGASWLRPMQASPFAIWNSTVGPVTVTVCGLAPSDMPVMNDDIWLEVEYLADPASTLGSMVTTTKASVIAPNAPLPADGSRWYNTTGVMFDFTQGFTNFAFLGGFADMLLSNGNRTATLDYTSLANASGGARSLAFQDTGKYYFETKVIANDNPASSVGVMSSLDVFGGLSNMGQHSFDVVLNDGRIRVGNGFTGKVLGKFLSDDVAGIALDLYHRGWIRKNNGPWNGDPTANPAGGIGGLALPAGGVSVAPAVYLYGTAGNAVSLNCGWSAYAAPPPLAFGNWPPASPRWKPFRLTTTVTPAHAGYIHVRVMVAKPSTTFFVDPLVVLG